MFSVIVPVHNSELYLPFCLKSLSDQTFSDFEVLLIINGCTDKSEEICRSYSTIDERFKIFHSKLNGVSNARNVGVSLASFEYILFVDSDDLVSPDFLISLLSVVSKSYYDILFYNYNVLREGNFFESGVNLNFSLSKINLLNQLFLNKVSIPIWSCLFRKSLIDKFNLKFNSRFNYGEDQDFVLRAICVFQNFGYLDLPLYFYRIHNFSAMSKADLRHFDFVLALKEFSIFFKKEFASNTMLYSLLKNYKIPNSIFFSLEHICQGYVKNDLIMEFLKDHDLFQYLDFSIGNSSLLSLRLLIWNLSPYFYLYLIRFKYKFFFKK